MDATKAAVKAWLNVVEGGPVTRERIRWLTDGNNAIYQLAEMLEALAKYEPKQSLEAAMASASGTESADDYRLAVVGLFHQAMDLYTHVRVTDQRIAQVVGSLKLMASRFMVASGRGTVGDFNGVFSTGLTVEFLVAYANAVSAHLDDSVQEMDRSAFNATTDDLIGFLRNSNFPAQAREAMILKLNAVSRLSRACAFLPDDDIRRRVKAVYADFCAEFDRLDRKHAEVFERVTSWAKAGAKVGIFALALTSDVSQVAGLIEGPKDDGPVRSQPN